MKANWKHHYTGIDVAEHGPLYLQRDSHDKQLRFARVSGRRWMVGVFLHRTNHLRQQCGVELFTSDLHGGVLTEPQRSWVELYWSGSPADPHRRYSLRFGRLFLGSRTDAWLKRLVRAHQDRKDREYAEAMNREFGEQEEQS